MKKILMLSTGGTIASQLSKKGLVPKLSGNTILNFIPELSELCIIDCQEVMNLDSTNIGPEEWKVLAQTIYKLISSYDGIVISHGTDTMAYTASMLSYMLLGLPKPVILTGSQLPLLYPNTDGKRNLIDAFRTAITGIPGVYIVFDSKIIKGVRASKTHSTAFHGFESINVPIEGYLEHNTAVLSKIDTVSAPFKLIDTVNEDILLLKTFPGINPQWIQTALNMNYKGIIIESFGAGGVPYYKRNFLPQLEKAIQAGVTVLCTTQCLYDGVDLRRYEVGVKASEIGVLSAKDMTIEALSTKLMWALGQYSTQPDKVKELMQTNICGEITI